LGPGVVAAEPLAVAGIRGLGIGHRVGGAPGDHQGAGQIIAGAVGAGMGRAIGRFPVVQGPLAKVERGVDLALVVQRGEELFDRQDAHRDEDRTEPAALGLLAFERGVDIGPRHEALRDQNFPQLHGDIIPRSTTLPTDVYRCIWLRIGYSISSSALASNTGGRVRPRALAVLVLTTRSYLVSCATGRSPGAAKAAPNSSMLPADTVAGDVGARARDAVHQPLRNRVDGA